SRRDSPLNLPHQPRSWRPGALASLGNRFEPVGTALALGCPADDTRPAHLPPRCIFRAERAISDPELFAGWNLAQHLSIETRMAADAVRQIGDGGHAPRRPRCQARWQKTGAACRPAVNWFRPVGAAAFAFGCPAYHAAVIDPPPP